MGLEERNPLVDPAPGDVVRYRSGGFRYALTVMEVGRAAVRFRLASVLDNTEAWVSLDQWRDWSDYQDVSVEVTRGS